VTDVIVTTLNLAAIYGLVAVGISITWAGLGFLAGCVGLVLLVVFGAGLSWHLLAIPVLVGLIVLTALGVSVWLSALDVQYRDVRYAVPFLIQVWLFATPVIYSAGDVPETWRPVLALNPMTGVIEAFRWALLGVGDLPLTGLAVSTALVLVLLGTGLLYFRRMERTFADVI